MNKKLLWQQLFVTSPTPIERMDGFQGVNLSIKRDDLNHPLVQGNKLRKLKYNFKRVLNENYSYVATFGGAWSNHILATAAAAHYCGLYSIGFIRGDELRLNRSKWSHTLKSAEKKGMELVFLSRSDYRLKEEAMQVKSFLYSLKDKVYIIPEGGSNSLAIQGVSEVIDELKQQIVEPTHIISACGTGGTLAGLIDGVVKQNWNTKVLGIPVLKEGLSLNIEIEKLSKYHAQAQWGLYGDYHAGGYAKMDKNTLKFAQEFTHDTGIKLDKIYTAKSFYAAYDLIRKEKIPEASQVVILHTGGLQGGAI